MDMGGLLIGGSGRGSCRLHRSRCSRPPPCLGLRLGRLMPRRDRVLPQPWQRYAYLLRLLPRHRLPPGRANDLLLLRRCEPPRLLHC
ncbi:hypothetical protein RHOER0001_5107, partial [Rhodococcus erythropolis SK121]